MNIYCPFCDAVREPKRFGFKSVAFQKRNVVDAGPRPLARCATCGAFERERMLQWCMKERLGIKRSKLLHFAPSRSTHLWLEKHGQLELTNTDLNPRGYKYAGKLVQADITDLPFDDQSFDFIICSHVMEHIPDDLQALKQVRRVLKHDGCAFFMVPLVIDGKGAVEDPSVDSDAQRLELFGQSDHVRIYDSNTFAERLRMAGFSVDVFNPFTEDPIRAIAYGIGQGNAVFIGRNPT